MTRRRDISLTLALCLSLCAHAWIVYTVASWYVRSYARLFLPGLADLAVIVQPKPTQPPAVVERVSRLGDSDAIGQALAATPGEQPQAAAFAQQEQAALSLDPSGTGGPSAGPPPSPRTRPQQPSQAFASAAPAPSAPRFEVPGSFAIPEATPEFQPKTTPEQPRPAQPQPAQRQPDEEQPRESPPTPAGSAAASSSPGDPAPEAQSESDAFSTTPTADFRRGKTVARVGRKHKLINPRLEMAGYADLMQLTPPVTVVLRIELRPNGDVEKVDIIKSSGSVNVDVPTQQAAYKWWFEPARDRAGRPMPDVFEFVCRFT